MNCLIYRQSEIGVLRGENGLRLKVEIFRNEISVGKKLEQKHCPSTTSKVVFEFSNEVKKISDWTPQVPALGFEVTVSFKGKTNRINKTCFLANLNTGETTEPKADFMQAFQEGGESLPYVNGMPTDRKLKQKLIEDLVPSLKETDRKDIHKYRDVVKKLSFCGTDQGILVSLNAVGVEPTKTINIPIEKISMYVPVPTRNSNVENRWIPTRPKDFSQGNEITIVPQELEFRVNEKKRVDQRVFVPTVVGEQATLTKKVSSLISWESVTNSQSGSLLANLNDTDLGTLHAYYRVFSNANKILSLAWVTETMGAYTDESIEYTVIDLNSAKRVSAADAFHVNDLLAKLQKEQDLRIKKNLTKWSAAELAPVQETLKRRFQLSDLNSFFVTDEGVGFLFSKWKLSHLDSAMEPDRLFFFRWAEVKPAIKNPGPLSGFL